jgi:Matrixin
MNVGSAAGENGARCSHESGGCCRFSRLVAPVLGVGGAVGLVRWMQVRGRYREMERRLAKLDRLDRKGDARTRSAMPWLGRRWPLRDKVTLVVSCLAAVAVLVVIGVANSGWADPAVDSYPALPSDAAATRILPPVTHAPTGAHAFMMTTADGRPVTYDPCRPIHYVVNPTGMPPGGLELVRSASREISAASGLAFVEDGVTLEALVGIRSPRQPQRYGDRWAPVLIGWVDPARFPLVSGDIAGVSGSSVVAPEGAGSERYVSGQVALSRDWFTAVIARPGGEANARVVIMHEFGHLVGLAHVRDPGELMAESNSGVADLGPGDRQGLAAVGAGRCRTDT